MVWLAGIVVLLLFVFSPGFRKAIAIFAAVVAVIIGIFVSNQRESEREARTLIPASDVDLHDIKLQPDGFGDYKLVGRIKNNSPSSTLTGLDLKIVLEDCEGADNSPSSCVTIGEKDEHPYLPDIPPGQARDISDFAYVGSTKPKGRLVWHHSVSYTEGK